MEAIIGVTDGDGRWGTEMEGGSRPLGSRVAVMGEGPDPGESFQGDREAHCTSGPFTKCLGRNVILTERGVGSGIF